MYIQILNKHYHAHSILFDYDFNKCYSERGLLSKHIFRRKRGELWLMQEDQTFTQYIIDRHSLMGYYPP
jgi:hypothetical protein